MYCLSMPEPRKPGKSVESIHYQELASRYEVWADGMRRNIIYCDSIRNSFFAWIEDTYYDGSSAVDIEPRVKSMDNNESCKLLENWFVHEIVIQSHIPSGINLWLSEKENRKFLSRIKNVFNLGMAGFATIMSLNWHSHLDYNECGAGLAWYGRILDPQNEDDKRIIDQQRHAGLDSHPVEEDIDAVRRGYGATIRSFFDTLMNDRSTNYLTPVCLFLKIS
jgi:hypothetical protein